MKRNLVPAAAMAACLASFAAQAAPVAYVASDGRDRGRCTQANPCRTFQAAHDAVDAGGQVVALDGADYGPVTISKSVSIVGGGAAPSAAIDVASGNGVSIATAGIDVVLRNLRITGSGGAIGIAMTAGHSLTIEDSVVSGFASDGIRVDGVDLVSVANTVSRGNGRHGAFMLATRVTVVSSRFMSNAGSGLWLEGAGAYSMNASVTGSVASANGDRGFSARTASNSTMVSFARDVAAHNGGAGFANECVSGNALGRMSVGGSVAVHNAIGLFSSTAVTPSFCHLETLGDNQVGYNVQRVEGFVIAGAPM